MNTEKETVEQETIFEDFSNDFTPYQKNLKRARIWLYVLTGLQIVMGLYEINEYDYLDSTTKMIVFGIDAGIGLGFLACAIWSYKKPKIAFMVALIFYITVHLVLGYFNPASLLSGWLIKILFITALIRAYNDAKEFENLQAMNGK
jgi:hypothetical protein